MDHNLIHLKKYSNRRLYHIEKSVYITLADVAKMVKQGNQVKVIDVKTNQDVTAFILTQIIMEKAKKNDTLLPVSLLHLIIRFGENILSEFFETHLERTIRSYLAYKKNMEDHFKICLELGIDFSTIAEKTLKQMSQPFNPFFNKPSKEEKDKSETSE